jgi:hypothetical protein
MIICEQAPLHREQGTTTMSQACKISVDHRHTQLNIIRPGWQEAKNVLG